MFTLVTCGVAPSSSFGTISYIDGRQLSNGYLPGHNSTFPFPTDLSDIAILAQGYFLVPETGSYKLVVTIDDFGYCWLGQIAYNPWNGSTAVNQTTSNDTADLGEISLTQGDLVLMTILWANAGNDGNSRSMSHCQTARYWETGRLVSFYLSLLTPGSPFL